VVNENTKWVKYSTAIVTHRKTQYNTVNNAGFLSYTCGTIVFYGFLWIPMNSYEFLWIPMFSYEFPWSRGPMVPWSRDDSMIFYGFIRFVTLVFKCRLKDLCLVGLRSLLPTPSSHHGRSLQRPLHGHGSSNTGYRSCNMRHDAGRIFRNSLPNCQQYVRRNTNRRAVDSFDDGAVRSR
jgi:hypothetical protein